MAELYKQFKITEVIPDLIHVNRRNYTSIEFSDQNKNMILCFYFNNQTHMFEMLRLVCKSTHLDAGINTIQYPERKKDIYAFWDDFKNHPDLASYPKVRLKLLFA